MARGGSEKLFRNPLINIIFVYLVGLAVLFGAAWKLSTPFPASLTSSEKKYLAEKQSIIFVASNDFAPYCFYDARAEKAAGYEVDLVDRLRYELQPLGITANLIQLPDDQAMAALVSGEADILTGMSISSQNIRSFAFTKPYLYTSYGLVSRDGALAGQVGLQHLANYRVFTEQGSVSTEILQAHLTHKARGCQFHPEVVDAFIHILQTSTSKQNVYEFIVKVKTDFSEMERIRDKASVAPETGLPSHRREGLPHRLIWPVGKAVICHAAQRRLVTGGGHVVHGPGSQGLPGKGVSRGG